MTYRAALNEAVQALQGTDTPFLDSLVLLSFASKIPKERLLGSLDESIDRQSVGAYQSLISKRAAGIPVSYLRRIKEFWGLEFYVDERVLVPRPDTETLVETALKIIDEKPSPKLLDCCTGSGCVALSLKNERPAIDIAVSDVSEDALFVFAINCERLGLHVPAVYVSDLFREVPGRFDIITANPPYLGGREVADMKKKGWPEPGLALHGGSEGIELPIRLIHESLDSLIEGGYLIMEAAEHQIAPLTAEMRAAGFLSVWAERDLADRERVLVGTTGETPWSE